MSSHELDLVTRQVEKLNTHEQLLLMERIIALLKSQEKLSEIEEWDPEELQQLLNDNQPMTTQEFVKAGLFGGWEDLDINDSLQWVQQQRANTKGRYSW